MRPVDRYKAVGRLLLLVCVCLAVQGAESRADCRIDPPVAQIQATGFYVGAGSHEIDVQAMQLSNSQYRPVQMFVIHLSQNIDGPNAVSDETLGCATRLLDAWATSRALLTQPSNFEGARQRARFVIGLDLIAIKLLARGVSLPDSTSQWLGSLNQAVIADHRAGPRKGNLYIWSGVDAAAYALLSGNQAARSYSDGVWRDGLDAIQALGSVGTEAARGPKALLYHQYYLSALLLLRELRVANGSIIGPAEDGKLAALAALVTDGFCRRERFPHVVSDAKQDIPPAYQFAVPLAFGGRFLGPQWQSCVAPLGGTSVIDSGFGGDMRLAASAVRAVADLKHRDGSTRGRPDPRP